jgi:surface protein
MKNMFCSCHNFNADLSTWNVANATNLSGMFASCGNFNSDVSRWNMTNALDLSLMFYHCTSFNSDVSQWDIASASRPRALSPKALEYMFTGCVSFNREHVATWPLLPDE